MKQSNFWLVFFLVNSGLTWINVASESYGLAAWSALIALWCCATATLHLGLENGLRGRDGAPGVPGVPGPMGEAGLSCQCQCGRKTKGKQVLLG